MGTIYATTNAKELSAFFIERADGVRLYGAAASGVLAKSVKSIVLPLLVDEAPKVTSELANSQDALTTILPGGADVDFGANAGHADFVLNGTGIYHVPDAHSAWDVDGYQAFMVQGSMVYTNHTHHEGQKPNDWPERAWTRAEAPIELALQVIDDRLWAVFL